MTNWNIMKVFFLTVVSLSTATVGQTPAGNNSTDALTEEFTEQTSITLEGVAYSSVSWGDYDNDGDLDILLTGENPSAVPVSKIYRNNGDGTFTYQPTSLTNVKFSSVAWGDYDSDGDLDILYTGMNSSFGPVSMIYKNNGDGTFSEQTSISLKGVLDGSIAWGDYDNDGDLDILLTGYSSDDRVSKIYKYNDLISNSIPNAPTNLNSTVSGNSVTFNWDKSTDNETPQNGLNYNLVIGTTANNVNTLSPMANRTTGFRRVVRLGNSQRNSWTINNLPDGIYYWSVQAIDGAFAGSLFASEQTVAVNVPLPVELTTFIGKVSGSQVVLNWETKTELDNYGFEIERSKDGDNWTKIGFIEGSGTSNSPRYYRFEDKLRTSGTINYRLKQLDNSGTFAYSDPVQVEMAMPTEYKLYQNYPNPFNPATKIDFDLPRDCQVNLSVYDVKGDLVMTLLNAPMPGGRHTINFDASGMPSGVFFYRLTAGDFVTTKKLIVIK